MSLNGIDRLRPPPPRFYTDDVECVGCGAPVFRIYRECLWCKRPTRPSVKGPSANPPPVTVNIINESPQKIEVTTMMDKEPRFIYVNPPPKKP